VLKRDAALATAQRLADKTGGTFEVYEHVGAYGRPNGDVPATPQCA
jgi:hypothetical protein